MRILFANATHDWGGEKSWALETALCLKERGHACVMVGRRGDRWVDECVAHGLDAHGLRFGPAIFNPLGIRNLLRVARSHRPDFILVNISRDMCAGVVVGAMLGVPVIRHVGLSEDLNHDPVDWLLHRHALAGTIAVGHEMRREMIGHYPWLPPERVEVIHIGKDTRLFQPGATAPGRRRWKLPEDAVVVGVTSQLEQKKGHAVLLEALHRLGDERVHLAIVGEGPLREALQCQAEVLDLGARVHFLGFTRALSELLRALDVFALPSFSEGFPNTLVEAMATGLPCIATRLCCVPEILEHGKSGLLVEPDDPEALATALGSLVADPALRRSLGAAARARVEEGFSLEATTDRLVAYLESIAARPRSAGPRL